MLQIMTNYILLTFYLLVFMFFVIPLPPKSAVSGVSFWWAAADLSI